METERLHLRLISEDDADFLHALMDNDKWRQMIGDRGVYSSQDARAYIKSRMHPDLNTKGFVNHVMIEKTSGKPVGTCSLHNRDGVDGIDIGYAISPEYEGKGYATEGALSMAKLAFNTYLADQVNAITSEVNIGSHRVVEKIGFKHDGYITLPGETTQIRLYSLTREEFTDLYGGLKN